MRYQYPDPDPQHTPFLEEIASLSDFNNLHLHLPGTRSWYEDIYSSKLARLGEDKLPEDTRVLPHIGVLLMISSQGLGLTSNDLRCNSSAVRPTKRPIIKLNNI
ncbi:MAG TPA: hypothetical protein VJH22_05235 [Candidatus Nanoarchaeia archaeon]|nr:hypothetical protein [Candidatus Nanoarchaeia archaeon]